MSGARERDSQAPPFRAGQVTRKNNEAWRSFLKLKKLEKKGKLPLHVRDWWYWTRRIAREQSRLG